MNKPESSPSSIAEYIASFPPDVQKILKRIRSTVKRAAPKANERISYGMPFYEYGGPGYKGRLIYFAAFKKHISVFITPRQSASVPKEMYKYHVSKATYRFPLDEPFPFALIEKTVKALVKERDIQSNEVESKTMIAKDIQAYNNTLSRTDRTICNVLAQEIDSGLPEAESKIWHGHPVWFLDGNPIVGYSKLKDCIRLLFWSGQSFDEPALQNEGKFKAAEARYTSVDQIVIKDLKRWLKKSRDIQWDYKNIVKRKGVLLRLR